MTDPGDAFTWPLGSCLSVPASCEFRSLLVVEAAGVATTSWVFPYPLFGSITDAGGSTAAAFPLSLFSAVVAAGV